MPAIQTPKSVPELLKLMARHGKRSVLLSGIDPAAERTPTGKVAIDVTGVAPLQEIEKKRDRVTLVEALRPESPYFDITTPLVLLEAKVRLQNSTGRRTLPIRDFLEAAT